MSDSERVIDLLTRIEENQRKGLEAQQAMLDRSNTTIQESIELQRVAVARQAKIGRIVLPLIGLLVALLVYLIIKWRIL
jgi:hypothetical protein